MSSSQECALFIFVLGPPGAGKSYLCRRTADKFHQVEHVVMSELLSKEAARPHSPWALEISQKLPTGTLVSSDACIAILKDFLGGLPQCDERIILLDGFPRNIDQARKFDEVAIPLAIIELTCLQETMEKRRAQRGRPDDDPAIAEGRYQGYLNETIPAIDYLRNINQQVVQVPSDDDGDEGYRKFEVGFQRTFSED